MLPQLNSIQKAVTNISTFRGLNRSCNTGFSRLDNSTAAFTEFKDMHNMTGDKYPQLAPRALRSRVYFDNGIRIISNMLVVNTQGDDGKSGDCLVFVADDKYLHFGNEKTAIEEIDVTKNHTLVLMGNKVVIFPEKLSVNISDKSITAIDVINEDKECIGAGVYVLATENCRTSIQKCCYDFKEITAVNIKHYYLSESPMADATPETSCTKEFQGNLETGDVIEFSVPYAEPTYFLCNQQRDTGINLSTSKINKQFDYVKINATGIGVGIKSGDFVEVSGMEHSVADGLGPLFENHNSYIDVLNNNTFKVYAAEDDYILIRAQIKYSVPYNGNITVTRISPQFDDGMIVEMGNRLWGCNSDANEIYCSKLGDETNWQAYSDGISTDSWYTVVGKQGRFTGAIKRNDSIIFFKENWALKVCGTKPSNFTLAEYAVQGVEKGSEKSLVNISGTLFYMGHGGVYAYASGSTPQLISEQAFDNERYNNGVAGRHGDKYYLSCQNESGNFELFVFDTQKGLWHKEDSMQMMSTITHNSTMYYLDNSVDAIMCPDDKDNILELMNVENICEFQRESEFDWSCETGDLYDSVFETKNISKIRIGIKGQKGARVRLLVQYRDNGQFTELAKIVYSEKKPRIFSAAIRRAEYLRLRFEGTGQVEIYGIDIEHSKGSDKRYGF